MQDLHYVPLEKVRVSKPVQRIAYIVEQVRNRKVLDLGALDETAYAEKENTAFWLHKRMCEVAQRVHGIDNSDLIPEGGLKAFPNSVIYKADVCQLKSVLPRLEEVDIIVAGELIEHLPNALSLLEAIKQVDTFQDKELIITTPNATSLHNFLIGATRRESSHIDHLSIYSYKTLNTLCKRAGFRSWEIIPYHVSFSEMILSSRGSMRMLAVVFERSVNFWETALPLLSGGWIVHVTI